MAFHNPYYAGHAHWGGGYHAPATFRCPRGTIRDSDDPTWVKHRLFGWYQEHQPANGNADGKVTYDEEEGFLYAADYGDADPESGYQPFQHFSEGLLKLENVQCNLADFQLVFGSKKSEPSRKCLESFAGEKIVPDRNGRYKGVRLPRSMLKDLKRKKVELCQHMRNVFLDEASLILDLNPSMLAAAAERKKKNTAASPLSPKRKKSESVLNKTASHGSEWGEGGGWTEEDWYGDKPWEWLGMTQAVWERNKQIEEQQRKLQEAKKEEEKKKREEMEARRLAEAEKRNSTPGGENKKSPPVDGSTPDMDTFKKMLEKKRETLEKLKSSEEKKDGKVKGSAANSPHEDLTQEEDEEHVKIVPATTSGDQTASGNNSAVVVPAHSTKEMKRTKMKSKRDRSYRNSAAGTDSKSDSEGAADQANGGGHGGTNSNVEVVAAGSGASKSSHRPDRSRSVLDASTHSGSHNSSLSGGADVRSSATRDPNPGAGSGESHEGGLAVSTEGTEGTARDGKETRKKEEKGEHKDKKKTKKMKKRRNKGSDGEGDDEDEKAASGKTRPGGREGDMLKESGGGTRKKKRGAKADRNASSRGERGSPLNNDDSRDGGGNPSDAESDAMDDDSASNMSDVEAETTTKKEQKSKSRKRRASPDNDDSHENDRKRSSKYGKKDGKNEQRRVVNPLDPSTSDRRRHSLGDDKKGGVDKDSADGLSDNDFSPRSGAALDDDDSRDDGRPVGLNSSDDEMDRDSRRSSNRRDGDSKEGGRTEKRRSKRDRGDRGTSKRLKKDKGKKSKKDKNKVRKRGDKSGRGGSADHGGSGAASDDDKMLLDDDMDSDNEQGGAERNSRRDRERTAGDRKGKKRKKEKKAKKQKKNRRRSDEDEDQVSDMTEKDLKDSKSSSESEGEKSSSGKFELKRAGPGSGDHPKPSSQVGGGVLLKPGDGARDSGEKRATIVTNGLKAGTRRTKEPTSALKESRPEPVDERPEPPKIKPRSAAQPYQPPAASSYNGPSLSGPKGGMHGFRDDEDDDEDDRWGHQRAQMNAKRANSHIAAGNQQNVLEPRGPRGRGAQGPAGPLGRGFLSRWMDNTAKSYRS